MTDTDTFFQDIFYDKQEKSKIMLENFLREPDEKQIHDLRKSIRRLEAVYCIFPNSCKRKKTDKVVFSYRSLFKKNSSIRDLDVIFGKLLKHGLYNDNDILKIIVKERNKKVKKIIKNDKKILKLKYSNLKKIETKKNLKKYDRIVYSLLDKIEKSMPIVVSDESKIDELHQMRKTAKKLRYILEIKEEQSYKQLIDKMKLFQELLGNIHDCDIVMNFLKQYSKKYPEVKYLILKETELRNQNYRKLAILSSKII